MTTNKDVLASLEALHIKVDSLLEKMTFVPADEPLEGEVEGGREEPGTATKPTKHIVMLNDGDKNGRFGGVISNVTDISEYDRKDGTKGRYQRFTIRDPTQEITITLWDDDIDKYAYVRVDDIVVVDAWSIGMYKSIKQAKLGKYGKITVTNEVKEKHIL